MYLASMYCKTQKIFLLLLIAFMGSAFGVNSQNLQLPLRGVWEFKADFYGEGEAQKWYNSNASVSWDKLLVPADWHQFVPYQQFEGKAWYKRQFQLVDSWNNSSKTIVFQRLPPQAKVWLNGVELQSERVANEVRFKLGSNVRTGGNTLVVSINNLVEDEFRRTSSGILGDVFLIGNPSLHLDNLVIHSTLEEDLKKAKLQIRGELYNATNVAADVSIKASVTAFGEDTLTFTSGPTSLTSNTHRQIEFTEQLKKVNTWSFDSPTLYQLQLYVVSGQDTIQSIERSIGFRTNSSKKMALELNGRPFKLNGVQYDIDLIAAHKDLLKKELKHLKDNGTLLVYIPFRVLSDEILTYCDALGMLVLVELPPVLEQSFGTDLTWFKKTGASYCHHPALLGWVFQDMIDSKWVRAVKESNRSLLLGQLVNTNSGKVLDNQYANLLVVESDLISKDLLKEWANYLQEVPFMVKLRGAQDNRLNNLGSADIPANFSGFFLEKIPVEIDTKSNYLKPASSSVRSLYGVDSLVITHSGQVRKGKKLKMLIEIRPRKSWEASSYFIEDHTLVWTARNSQGNVLTGGITDLKNIAPSDKSFIKSFDWKVPKNEPFQMVYQILSPQQAVAYSEVVFNNIDVSKPQQISERESLEFSEREGFVYINTNLSEAFGSIQVQLSTNNTEIADAPLLQVLTSKAGFYLKKPTTNSNQYFMRSRTVNQDGEGSEWSDIIQLTEKTEKTRPYEITNIKRVDSSVFVEYTNDYSYLFCSIEYKSTKAEEWQTTGLLQSTGISIIKNLNKRERYSYRLNIYNDNGEIVFTSPVIAE